ncbi:golgin subfamily A member 6-like protein 22 [Patiria miniata]|uniref:Uncharacterized protein n=1 Tax=Patiria miniata TaxID=46514 RepID=A0A914AHL0_PATMI|nr:golgin subfamily A member 6-like protein 22 [Patiria miniata]
MQEEEGRQKVMEQQQQEVEEEQEEVVMDKQQEEEVMEKEEEEEEVMEKEEEEEDTQDEDWNMEEEEDEREEDEEKEEEPWDEAAGEDKDRDREVNIFAYSKRRIEIRRKYASQRKPKRKPSDQDQSPDQVPSQPSPTSSELECGQKWPNEQLQLDEPNRKEAEHKAKRTRKWSDSEESSELSQELLDSGRGGNYVYHVREDGTVVKEFLSQVASLSVEKTVDAEIKSRDDKIQELDEMVKRMQREIDEKAGALESLQERNNKKQAEIERVRHREQYYRSKYANLEQQLEPPQQHQPGTTDETEDLRKQVIEL